MFEGRKEKKRFIFKYALFLVDSSVSSSSFLPQSLTTSHSQKVSRLLLGLSRGKSITPLLSLLLDLLDSKTLGILFRGNFCRGVKFFLFFFRLTVIDDRQKKSVYSLETRVLQTYGMENKFNAFPESNLIFFATINQLN